MTADSLPFSDATTRRVLGVEHYLEKLNPDSEAGRRRAKHPGWFGPQDLSERRELVTRRRRIDDWRSAQPDNCNQLRRALGNIPQLKGVISSLHDRETLDEGELFEFKQFLVYSERALDAGHAVAEHWGLEPDSARNRLIQLQETIHPGAANEPEFRLTAEHDTSLAEAKRRRDQMRRRRNERRASLEDAIRHSYGGNFGFDGTYRPPRNIDVETLQQDDRLRQAGTFNAPVWRLNDGELEELEAKLDSLETEHQNVAARVRTALSETLFEDADWLAQIQDKLARIDVALAACRLREKISGCWGTAARANDTNDRTTHTILRSGREPSMAEAIEGSIQPIDVTLEGATTIVTGPNMGGKSKLLILLGMCQWAAQHALPVPAEDFEFQPVNHLIYVGSEQPQGTEDFQDSGLSAFAREIQRIVRWSKASAPASWLLDEVGRGTHPGDGAELLVDLLAQLADDAHRAVASSHFPTLASLEGVQHLQIRGLPEDVDLQAQLSDPGDVERTLRDAIDHQPNEVATGLVPRDARRVATALGLELGGTLFASHTRQDMTNSETRIFDTKDAARDWVWTELREQGAARFPFPIRDRIPNFDGAREAARRLFDSSVLDAADAIKVNPDSPQKFVRRIALEKGVTVYVPTPRLQGGFMRFDPDTIDETNFEDASMLSRWEPYKQEVPLEEMPQLDAIVTGCVAVTRGGERCGKGEGYSDLEYAILRELGHDPVPVYTTVHTLQIVEKFPTEPHDLCLAGIATPAEWLDVSEVPAGPDGIDWSQLSDTDLELMPVLRQLKPS